MKDYSFLNYYKLILEKVSFDNNLLQREYKKAKKTIAEEQHVLLDAWMRNNGLLNKIELSAVPGLNSR